MAIDKLALYNNALLNLGQRKLDNVTEDRPPRYYLDVAYDLGAVDFCLETARPLFARKTTELDSPAVSSEHALDQVHTLPADYLAVYAVYADDTLDTPIERYIIEGNTLACDHAVVYLRYVSDEDNETYTNWAVSFANVVSAYLAVQVSTKIAPDEYEKMVELFTEQVRVVSELDRVSEPEKRSSGATGTLTNTWRKIYNDALFVMGIEEITDNDDDSDRRAKLDRALDAGIVAELLEDVGWNFALSSVKSEYNPSVSPTWGYSYVHDVVTDLVRLHGIFADEHMRVPLKDYVEEEGQYMCNHTEIYVQYVDNAWLTTPDSWPTFFRRLVAAKMAKDAAGSIPEADTARADETYADRRSSAMSNNAVSSPPRKIFEGSWVRARGGTNLRGRP